MYILEDRPLLINDIPHIDFDSDHADDMCPGCEGSLRKYVKDGRNYICPMCGYTVDASDFEF